MVTTKDTTDQKPEKARNERSPYRADSLKNTHEGAECILKIICSLIAYMDLGKDYSRFTGITIFLFLFPVTIDLFFYKTKNIWVTIVKSLVLLVNIGILLISFSSSFGFIQETLYEFTVVPTAIIFSGFPFSKHTIFVLMMILNVPMTVLCYIGSRISDGCCGPESGSGDESVK